MPLKLLNWNVEWAAAKWKAAELQRRIAQHAADIICLTETDTARLALPPDGHSICAQDNWGQPFRKGQEGRRKVLLWSRAPWEDVDDVGNESLRPGRFVSGVTQTGVGEVTVIGVCLSLIPLAGGSMLEPEDAGGPRGVSGWPCRIAETVSQSAPRRGGRFQPADRAAQFNAAMPPCSPPVHPRPEPVHCHHGPGLSGAENHRPHRVEPGPGRRLPRRHQQPPSGRRPVGPFRPCCRPSPVSLVLATWTEDCVAGLTATRYVGEPGSESAHLGINRWVALFAGACPRAVSDARQFEERVRRLQAGWRERADNPCHDSAMHQLIGALPSAPVLTVTTAAELTGPFIPGRQSGH